MMLRNIVLEMNDMKKIKIVINEVIEYWKTGEKMNICIDRDGNRYYKKINSEKWAVTPSMDEISKNGYKEGYGLCIEEAYCHMNQSFNIPDRLTN